MDKDKYIEVLEKALIKTLKEADDWYQESRGYENVAPNLEIERELGEAIKRKNPLETDS